MPSVVFVAPFFLPTTLRFINAVAGLPGVATGLVSQDPVDRLPASLRARLAAHEGVDDALDPEKIVAAARSLTPRLGPVSRVLGTLEELQVPLGIVRERLGVPGMGAEASRNFRDKSRMKTVLRAAGPLRPGSLRAATVLSTARTLALALVLATATSVAAVWWTMEPWAPSADPAWLEGLGAP